MKREKAEVVTKTDLEPIALVGIGCRFPGNINGPDELWQGLKEGIDAITDIPGDRWNNDVFYDPDPNKAGKIKSKKGGFLKDIDKFDADFFGVFPAEASRIDPQQRFLLEVTYEALEDAGISLESISDSKTGVYIGVFTNDYWDIQVSSLQKDQISPQVPMGVILTAIANRISYTFNLKGPSITLDTACSSSLVTVHLACQSIWSGESEQALAGGVNMIFRPESSIMMSKGNFLSPDGYCKSFDSRANGYVRSEGCGVIVLKPLSKAEADGDDIYAIIRSTAVNQDGYTEDGFTVPSADSQIEMLRSAYEKAGISPDTLSYLEAHGTGTPVGDPLETKAFGAVVGKNRSPENKCTIGSIKTNLGHLEAAAGIAGIIKLALVLRNKQIPPNLHFIKPNPKIPFEDYRLKVATQLEDLPTNGQPPIGGVNSFGAGGTNAHAVLQAYDKTKNRVANGENREEKAHIFTLSAKNKEALKDNAKKHIAFLDTTDADLGDICYSSTIRRSSHPCKLAIAVRSKNDLKSHLQAFINDETRPGMSYQKSRGPVKKKIGFVFSGQGPQWYAMGQELFKSNTLFKEIIIKIDHLFSKIADFSLLEEMNKDEANSRVSETRIAQPAIMAIQIGLAEIWKSWGVLPDACVGHSIGEVAAAYTSGALSLEQAVEVIYHRSKGQHKATDKGKMLAVGLPLESVKREIKGYEDVVSIAAINGPNLVTLSGDAAPLNTIAERLDKNEVFYRFLKVNVPFHSHHMDPLKDDLIDALTTLKSKKAELPLYSTVTGQSESGEHLNSAYWFRNVREPVYFTQAVNNMIDDGFHTFIEIAPHPVLSNGVNELLKEKEVGQGLIIPSLRRKEDEEIRMLESLGKLYTAGNAINWSKMFEGDYQYVKLPHYSWQHESYWFESDNNKAERLGSNLHPHIKSFTQSANNPDQGIFELNLDKSIHPYIEGHKVDGTIIFPGTGHLEIATAVGKQLYDDDFFLENIHFESALFLPEEGEAPEVRLEIFSGEGNYAIYTKGSGQDQWTKHSRGVVNHSGDKFFSKAIDLRKVQEKVNEPISVSDFYLELKEKGLQYGEPFRLLKHIWQGPNALLGLLELGDNEKYGVEKFNFHPALLDASVHLIEHAGKWTNDEQNGGIYLPTYISKFKMHRRPENVVWCYANVLEANESMINADFWIVNESGELVVEIQGFVIKYIEGSRGESHNELYQGMYEYQWEKQAGYKTEAPVKNSGTSVIFVDDAGIGEKLANKHQAQGDQVFVIKKGTSFKSTEKNCFEVIPNSQGHIEQALNAIQDQGQIDKVIYLWSLEVALEENFDTDQLLAQQSGFSQSMLNAMRAITGIGLEVPIYSLTQGLEYIHEGDDINLNQATALGISRVLMNEFSHIDTRIIDISKNASDIELDNLYSLLTAATLQNISEIGLREDQVYFRKLRRVTEESASKQVERPLKATGTGFQLMTQEQGDQANIIFAQTHPTELTPGILEIEVQYAGISRAALGKFSGGEDTSLKSECTGIITAIGPDTEGFKVGDKVISFAPQPLSGEVYAQADHTILKPEYLTFEEAAMLSGAFLTAYFSMDYLVKIQKGAVVLIHDATTSAGLAAIQLATLKEALIIASSDSEEKCRFLESLGIQHVFNHRNPGFADYIKKHTPKGGVDVVLNTLRGKGLTQTLKCLLPYGALINLNNEHDHSEAMRIHSLTNNGSYFNVNIDNLMLEKPELCKQLLREILSLRADDKIHSIPAKQISITDLKETLSPSDQNALPEQLVVELEKSEINVLPPRTLSLSPDATYLITGGASGFGLWLAKWLAEKGARHLVLVSRSGCKTEEDREIVDRLERQGLEINLVNIDITKYEDVKMVLSMVSETMPPLKGIIHSAAVLEDATLANMDQHRFFKVFGPKALGAWNLHQGTKEDHLDFFLMLSSISSMFGLPGQSNYSSANNFLDKLAHYRQSRGWAGSSANLGVLGNYAGMSKGGGNVLNVLANQGWLPLSFRQVSDKIENILLQKPAQRMAANLDWKRFKDFFAHLNEDFRFEEFIKEAQLNAGKEKQSGSTLIDQVLSTDLEQRPLILQEKIADALARILGTTSDKIEQEVPISNMGLDSLMLNQLRNWIHQKLEINYPLMRIAKGPSIRELALQLLKELAPDQNESHVNTNDASGISNDPDMEVLAEKWLVRNKKNNQTINHRIFCIHPVGAGASMFTHFLYNQPKNTDVLAIQLPGRENRANEAPYENMPLLIEDLANIIKPYTDKPFIILGHSFGGIVGFELIKYLRSKFGITPLHLFITGTIAPQLTKEWKKRESIHQTSKHSSSVEKILKTINYIDDVEFLKSIIPVMRHDMPLIMNYPYAADEPFDFPITGFAADKDEVVLISEVKCWKEQTKSEFNLEIVEGDHWFLGRNRDLVLQRLTEALDDAKVSEDRESIQDI